MIVEILMYSLEIVFLMLFSPTGAILVIFSVMLGYVYSREVRKRQPLPPSSSSRYGSSHKRKVKR